MKSKLRLLVILQAMVAALVVSATASASGTPALFAETGLGSNPTRLVVDGSGSIFVIRSSPRGIAKVTSAGAVTSAWSTAPGSNSWNSVVVGPGDAVYASADAGSNPYIQKLNADGSVAQNYSTSGSDRPSRIAVDASGNIFYYEVGASSVVAKIPAGGGSITRTTVSFQASSIAVDAAGNVYVAGRTSASPSVSKLVRYANDLTNPHDYNVDYGSANGCFLTAGPQYVYCAYNTSGSGSSGRVSRVDGLTFDTTWANLPTGAEPRALQAGSDGFLYVASGVSTQAGQSGLVSKISPAGEVATLATMSWLPQGLGVDASTNVFISGSPSGWPNPDPEGIYKIAQAAPTPDPSPSPSPTPAPGPAVKTNTIPSQIRIASETTPEVKVPCEAADGELLTECTVQITAPRSVLAGIGQGIEVTNARATTTVTLGKATIKPKTPKKRVVVTVKFNRNGKRALSRNVRVSGLIDLTAITQANTQSTGKKRVRLQLPRQTMTPTKGIFDTLSTSLNRDGVIFVNRLAKYLPKKPKRIVCTGYADANGSPGDNRWLGEQRAKTLCNELAKRGIKPTKTSIISRGADDPRAPNTTPAGRAENRRATITITY